MSQLAQFVKEAALAEGFSLAGIAPAAPLSGLEHFPAWIAAGFHGEMDYLARTNDAGALRRAALQNAAPWARSVVVCAVNYNSDTPYSTECDDPKRGWIARYAFVERDYHDVLLPRLRRVEQTLAERIVADGHPAPRTWCYVDTGPVVERALAERAGIGWIGKNACLIHPKLGSWLFLGVILCSHALAPDLPAPERCGSCTRCIDACPTDAIVAPYQLDARRCISYLTIEQRGPVADNLRAPMGHHLFGCDICQDVCPWNRRPRRAPASREADFAPRTQLVNPALEWISGMKVEEFRRVFRGSPVKRAKLRGLLRTAAIAMGNRRERAFLPRLRELAQSEDESVAEHARWAIARLEALSDADTDSGSPPEAVVP
jgi:epoxyqueuosine reductase